MSWPTGEFGGMGLEGLIKLGYRDVLAAIDVPQERLRQVAKKYECGKALNNVTFFGIDDTIDPADPRRWVDNLLSSVRLPPHRKSKKHPAIDAW